MTSNHARSLSFPSQVDEHPNTLRGRALRFVLVDALRGRDSMTVAEMIADLQEKGFRVAGRASKTISDALRWERARGRVVRVRRGLYRFGSVPKTTGRRIRVFAERCRAWVVAATRSQEPVPIPHRRAGESGGQSWTRSPQAEPQPGPPPWADLGWLWVI